MQTKHTPTPWHLFEMRNGKAHPWIDGEIDTDLCVYGEGNRLATIEQWMGEKEKAESDANAAFIVRACNAHDEMVAALEGIIKTWEGPRERAAVAFAAEIVKARAALAKAKGQ